MKANVILDWIVRESIQGEFLGVIDVPDEGDVVCPQNEEWWWDSFGALPPAPIPAGKYLYYYTSQINDEINDDNGYHSPDAEIEDGDGSIYLYRIEVTDMFTILHKSVGGRVFDRYFQHWDNAKNEMNKEVDDFVKTAGLKVTRRFDYFNVAKGYYVYQVHGLTDKNEEVVYALLEGHFQD